MCLQISILACNNLPNIGDSYVKLRLSPITNEHRVKTRVIRNTNSPVFDEQFTLYGVSAKQLEKLILELNVLTYNRYSSDRVLGEARFSFADAQARRRGCRSSTTTPNASGASNETIELPLHAH